MVETDILLAPSKTAAQYLECYCVKTEREYNEKSLFVKQKPQYQNQFPTVWL